MLIRMHPDVIALKPRAVVILAGTNDLASATGPATLSMIEDNLAAMTEVAQSNGIKVVLASVLPVNDYMESDRNRSVERPPEKIVQLNAWIRTYAQNKGCVYLDYHSALLDERHALKKELSPDGLHPNVSGYAVMAPLAEHAIAQAFAR